MDAPKQGIDALFILLASILNWSQLQLSLDLFTLFMKALSGINILAYRLGLKT